MGRNGLRRVSVALLTAALLLLAAAGASARLTTSVNTSLVQGKIDILPRSETVPTVRLWFDDLVADNRLGAHADFIVDLGFDYGDDITPPENEEDPENYPPGTDFRETVKNLVVEIPPGLVGNPNAIPVAERCDPVVFETGECPESATVGELWLKYSVIHGTQENPAKLSIVPLGPQRRKHYTSPSSGYTRVSLLRTDPEVPAVLGIFVKGPLNIGLVRMKLEVSPVTSEDLRLRTITLDPAPQTVWNFNTDEWNNIRLERMVLNLFGTLPNGHSFMTSPTSCQPWTTRVWSNAHFGSGVIDGAPLGGLPIYTTSAPPTITPDCSNAAALPFPITGGVSISTPDRATSPAFYFQIDNPGVQGDGQASTSPKSIVTRIPASINVDVAQLGRLCTTANFNADACPALSRVGTVTIRTPLIAAGLTGDVYLVKDAGGPGLPDLGLRVRGAITFTQRGSNRYTGATYNQIETTFDNIPQVGFSSLTFHLFGGSNGLLRSLPCPTYNKAPAVPDFTYTFTSWSGATKTSTTKLNMASCFGIQQLKSYKKCLHKRLPVRPNYQSRARVKKVQLKIDGKTRATARKSPFRFNPKLTKLKLKKRKGNKHKLEVRAVYDDGTVSKKRTTFRTCRR